jgi:hypothetical protein
MEDILGNDPVKVFAVDPGFLAICLPSDPDATILTSYVLPLHLFASADVVKRPLTLLGDEEYFQLATDKWSNRVIAFTLEFQKA